MFKKTDNDRVFDAKMYTKDNMLLQHAGNHGELMGCMRREIKTFFDYESAPWSNMVLGEVLNAPGKWSSYPPHHHPQPEVYFYRFDYPQGFGAGFANGQVYHTRHNGCLVINHSFHSQVTAPGYAMCYMWGIRHLPDNPWKRRASTIRSMNGSGSRMRTTIFSGWRNPNENDSTYDGAGAGSLSGEPVCRL